MDFPAGQVRTFAQLSGSAGARETVRCDVAVVGSGAGGAPAAWALAAGGARVALLEEGRLWEPRDLVPKQSVAFRNLYWERGARVMTGNIFVPLPCGRAVGGTTLVNSAICFRGLDPVLRRWADQTGAEWADPARLAPLYDEVQRITEIAPTNVLQARRNNLVFKRGADALGLKGGYILRNAAGCEGCGVCQLGCPVGGKGSTDRNFVPMMLEAGGALFTDCRVETVEVRGGRAAGVTAAVIEPESETQRASLRVEAKAVFLCAGAVGTPLLLLRNGLANSSGWVGRNLHVHPSTGTVALFDEVVDMWDGVPQGYYVDDQERGTVVETFTSTPEVFFAEFDELAVPLENLRHLAACGGMIGDVSEGRVRASGGGRADIAYNVTDGDKRRLLEMLRLVGKVFFAAGARAVLPGVSGSTPAQSLPDFLRQLPDAVPVDQVNVYASHPMATCRTGRDKAASVTSPTGETHDVKGLYVADASVFPEALGVNPQWTIMALALSTARGALQRGL